MNYGFVIDNRMCIGCHACTVACKSEHDIPIGVNRTHVKYIEKGQFPNSTREFSVHRCNHCEDAPCVEICPTTALYDRADGIVDFDSERCIGCKSCMQACPYDALYIDPDTHTAAKCNYCAHKVDYGYEPACVVVCPVEAIISGDLDDPTSNISHLVKNEKTMTRKPEKLTVPNLYYINGSDEMLNPTATERSSDYLWSEQSKGVGHFAKYAEERVAESNTENLLVQLAMENSAKSGKPIDRRAIDDVAKEINEDLQNNEARRTYDTPSKGVLWGWEVSTYVWTKAIATGTFLIISLFSLIYGDLNYFVERNGMIVSLIFMAITGLLLVLDLDRPDRFLYVLLRPQWKSWLVRGAYIITTFGGLVTLKLIDNIFEIGMDFLWYLGAFFAIMGAIYTAFLFAQAKARDLWQSKWASAMHMLNHAIIAGLVVITVLDFSLLIQTVDILIGGIIINLLLITKEIFFPRDTSDTKEAITLIKKGYYAKYFWTGVLAGNFIPFIMLLYYPDIMFLISGLLIMSGIFLTELVRIRVPQMIPLS